MHGKVGLPERKRAFGRFFNLGLAPSARQPRCLSQCLRRIFTRSARRRGGTALFSAPSRAPRERFSNVGFRGCELFPQRMQFDFAEKKFAADPVEQKHYLSEQVMPLLGAILDPLEQDHYVHKLSTRFLISEKTILDQIKKQAQGKKPELSQAIPDALNRGLLLEKQVLGGLLNSPDFLEGVKAELSAGDFEDNEIKNLIEGFINSSGFDPAKVKEAIVAKEAQFMVESQLDELEGNSTALRRELLKAFALLKLSAIKKRQQALLSEIKRAESEKNKQTLDNLSQQFARISAQRMKFETLL